MTEREGKFRDYLAAVAFYFYIVGTAFVTVSIGSIWGIKAFFLASGLILILTGMVLAYVLVQL